MNIREIKMCDLTVNWPIALSSAEAAQHKKKSEKSEMWRKTKIEKKWRKGRWEEREKVADDFADFFIGKITKIGSKLILIYTI